MSNELKKFERLLNDSFINKVLLYKRFGRDKVKLNKKFRKIRYKYKDKPIYFINMKIFSYMWNYKRKNDEGSKLDGIIFFKLWYRNNKVKIRTYKDILFFCENFNFYNHIMVYYLTKSVTEKEIILKLKPKKMVLFIKNDADKIRIGILVSIFTLIHKKYYDKSIILSKILEYKRGV